jgi:hypothetical protein
MSAQLNDLIDQTRNEKRPNSGERERVKSNEVRNAEKAFQIYQNERNRFQARLNQLQNPDYLFKIKSETT